MFRAATLICVVLAAACTAAEPAPAERRDVIVHLFQWPWADVGRECTTTLGPAGVAGVQISPPQEHVSVPGFPWWQDYQPTGYRIRSRRGDRDTFASMVRQCHQAGVKIYADAVLNHALKGDPADYHNCGRSIANYQDRFEVQHCDLLGLPDLATGREHVRARLRAYLMDLKSLGVDGFRIDAAKHMPAADVRAITEGLTVYSEVLYSPAEPIQPGEYRDFGATLEPRYAEKVSRTFRLDSFVLLQDRFKDLLPGDGTVVYVDSHDSQRGTGTLSYKDDARYRLAVRFMLAHPYGTPLLMSGFAFERFDDGPPSAADGTTLPVQCGQTWLCEHREVLDLVRWRAAMGDAPVRHWWATDNQLGFARGDRGYFALNRAAAPVTQTVQTGLRPGVYSSVTVRADGTADITIPAEGTVVLP